MVDSYDPERKDWDATNKQGPQEWIEPPVSPPASPGYAFQSPVPPPPARRSYAPWIIALIGLLVTIFCVIGAIAMLDKDGDKKVGAPAPAVGVTVKPKPALTNKIGQPIKDGKFTFTIQSMKCDVDSVGETFLAKKAKGDYCILNLVVANHGDKPQTFVPGSQKGFIGKVQYAADDAAIVAASGANDSWIAEINPGTAATVKLIYDVPSDKKLTTVELHDSVLSDGATVTLK